MSSYIHNPEVTPLASLSNCPASCVILATHRPMMRASSLPTSYIFVLRCSDMSLFFNFQIFRSWHFNILELAQISRNSKLRKFLVALRS
ncbi:unnamed protein product [Cuscuta campestris]|uniref:Uncharacterized protein n=1 Tax=Cuscuta campestris TaxID=132261 RepID=A0A484LJC9_9ASTE|nr:unnamed protein product [Cuscuta campestris]